MAGRIWRGSLIWSVVSQDGPLLVCCAWSSDCGLRCCVSVGFGRCFSVDSGFAGFLSVGLLVSVMRFRQYFRGSAGWLVFGLSGRCVRFPAWSVDERWRQAHRSVFCGFVSSWVSEWASAGGVVFCSKLAGGMSELN